MRNYSITDGHPHGKQQRFLNNGAMTWDDPARSPIRMQEAVQRGRGFDFQNAIQGIGLVHRLEFHDLRRLSARGLLRGAGCHGHQLADMRPLDPPLVECLEDSPALRGEGM